MEFDLLLILNLMKVKFESFPSIFHTVLRSNKIELGKVIWKLKDFSYLKLVAAFCYKHKSRKFKTQIIINAK